MLGVLKLDSSTITALLTTIYVILLPDRGHGG